MRGEIGKPARGGGAVGEIGLAEDEQTALAAREGDEFRIAAGIGEPRVAEFDDDVYALELIAEQPLGAGHVAGIPLDLHNVTPYYRAQSGRSRELSSLAGVIGGGAP